jgi:hypothetical protein
MITDLTDIFVQALGHASQWHAGAVSADLARLILEEGGSFEWGRTSGEEWMALDGAQRRQCALVWTHAPLAILKPHVSDVLRAFLARHDALCIEEADWNAVAYCIHPEVIRAHGLPYFWPPDPDDPTEKAFSILDLYDLTNN